MMSSEQLLTADILAKIQQASNPIDIRNILKKIAFEFGFDWYTYSRIFPKHITRRDMIAIGNYSEQWKDHYMANDYMFYDPVMKHCTSNSTPYFWKNIFVDKDELVIEFAKSCLKFNFIDGFSIGLKGYYGDYSLLNFGTSTLSHNLLRPMVQAVYLVHIILPYLHEKIATILPLETLYPTKNQQYFKNALQILSNREKQCLLWTAEGKTCSEISTILTISGSTVNFHLNNSCRKLDCLNKTHAVAKAVLLGLVENRLN